MLPIQPTMMPMASRGSHLRTFQGTPEATLNAEREAYLNEDLQIHRPASYEREPFFSLRVPQLVIAL
jgi:hypothetical protein